MTKLVSVIIPLKDNHQFVLQALKSLCDQTYPHLEILISCFGMTKQNLDLIETHIKSEYSLQVENRFIRFLYHEKGTLSVAINQGLQAAKGEYVTFLNPEDLYHPERIEKLMRKMVASNLDFAFTRIVGVDSKHQLADFDHPWMLWYHNEMFNIIHSRTLESKFLLNNIAVCLGNLFFSKKLIETIGSFKNLKTCYTLDYIFRAMQKFEINFLNEDLYYFRLYESNPKREGLVIDEGELNQLRLDYSIQVAKEQPLNAHAPTLNQLNIFRKQLKLNELLKSFVQTSQQITHNEIPFYVKSKTHSQKSNQKITLVTQDLVVGGGAPKLLLDLAQDLKAQGFCPKVFSLADGPLKKEFQKQEIPLFIIPKNLLNWTKKQGKIKRLFSLFKAFLYLYFRTDRHVIINSAASWPVALPFTLFSPFKKITWYIHESYSPVVYLDTGLVKKMLKKGIQKNTFSFWFGSESTKLLWKTAIGVTGKVMYWSGIKKVEQVSYQSLPIKNLLAIGTSHPRKGTHYLVDAFIFCIQNRLVEEEVCLTIVGIPEPIDDFNADLILKVLANQLQHRIKFVSCLSAEEIRTYYHAADLFIQASILECLPLSLLQAMSQGIPVISTEVNGCKEAIQHEVNGYLCRPFSSIALADAVAQAVKNPEKTRQMGAVAQTSFNEKFSLEITMQEILKEMKS